MRSVYKTMTYGVMHMVVAFAVAYAITGSWQLASGIALIEPIVQTFCYTLHEWAWNRKITKVRLMHPCGGHAGLFNS